MKLKTFFSSYQGLPKSVYALFMVRIINCFGSFVYPFLTMFLTMKLGYSTEKAGFFVTAVVVAGSLGLLSGGKLADRFGRKKIFIVLSIISAACFIICSFLETSPAIPWLIIVSNLFLGGVLPCINAMLTDMTNPGKKIHLNRCHIGGTFFFRKKILKKITGFKSIPFGEDFDFYTRIDRHFSIRKVTFPTYLYHLDSENRLCDIFTDALTNKKPDTK